MTVRTVAELLNALPETPHTFAGSSDVIVVFSDRRRTWFIDSETICP